MTAASLHAVVIDYGIGNVLNVCRALEHCGARVELTDSPQSIARADRLVLPGVGAFADGMGKLRDRGLIDSVRRFAESGRPFLGICLGMQMMFDSSEEFGTHEGLGLIAGRVVAIPREGPDGRTRRVPHMGWSALRLPPGRPSWSGSALESLGRDAHVYFVHSFTAIPADPSHRLADCDYDGALIAAAVSKGSLIGLQFHPEKSGRSGLAMLASFLRSDR